jgi:uncharacterized tellurite resistance protein B-like protein
MTPRLWSTPFYRKVSEGEFYCPKCQTLCLFDREKGRWWLTIERQPFLPLAATDDRIVCCQCRGVFGEFVLYQGAEESVAVFARTLRDVLLRLIVVDGGVDDAEIDALKEHYLATIGCELTDLEIAKGLEGIAQSNLTMVEQCEQMAPRLTQAAKEAVVRGAFLVASARGALSQQKTAQLRDLGPALGISPEAFRQLIEELA